ncbi:cell envelope-related function transcriptional attenuator common domain [Saccharomonospora marina XMU15]|uniref:Cell envelope-related function transcriptional attenuator common domain n=1 Tax=Saccharomonospora marina XMU15 TaxID=882083 RepID=H5X995_9PSEU|nr:LCP family protein [Saccharomonospora marina]EHR49197.1 cell envelope-related function transcriptional attenuator common domain [Saccharomonospora marina XMU15]
MGEAVAEGEEPEGGTESSAAATPQPPDTEALPRRRSPFRLFRRAVVALVALLALAATGYAYIALDTLQDKVNTTDALRQNESDTGGEVRSPPPPEDDGATDILLVGADSRTDMEGNPLPAATLRKLRTESKSGVNTDTLIVLRIPDDGGSPTGVSIPRDTWVDVPHGTKDKINSVYGTAKWHAMRRLRGEGITERTRLERESDQAGRHALVGVVQEFTRIRIDHYAEVNLLGFYLLTEALGGVKVCLNQATWDPDSGADFSAGVQVVSGGEALSFVRQRKNLPRGDLDRIVRQQAFLASALDKVLSAGTLTSSDRLDRLADTVQRSLVLDSDLDLLEFADKVRGVASGDIKFVTIPVVEIAARSPDGRQSIVTVDVNRVRSFVRDVVGDNAEGQPSGGGSAPPGVRTQITAEGVTCVN